MSNKYITIVVRMPDDEASKSQVREALDLLKTHTTAMSLEDEMNRLEMIENHPDFPEHIGWEAQASVAELQANIHGEPRSEKCN